MLRVLTVFFLMFCLGLIISGCSTDPIGKVPNDGFPANTYQGYPNESHDGD